ncbi:acetyl-CoA carboxylase carboxyltransferase subunit alpha [Mesocricetibacter intestinalis]|uniref:Acetyl-CoA carboxylase carboxyltransferase subunit alpha n=1 Tax=Mesocricetibacter intestinalis TaxID=1521930 RepID=A0A4V6PX04_9PAST|nr:zinc ribbon domain-containing protein [Mesocricetibacter intestinalis]TDQ59553.1 acetyl-CoA carboxylase carboxyltransferase subunit alpha [Mesocricetibacter intestinalis]
MALQRCPECRKKISESAKFCPHCGFSFAEADLEIYRQRLEQRRLHNREVNRKSAKLQLIWLLVFALVIALTSWLAN